MISTASSKQREAALAALQAGNRYQFLNLASAHLAMDPHDDYIRLMAIREYLSLRLIPPARELLDEAPGNDGDASPFAKLRESVSSIAGQAAQWSCHANRFEQNLRGLGYRPALVNALREAWSSHSDRLQLLVDSRGAHHLRRRDEAGRWSWGPWFADHQAEENARPLPDDVKSQMPGPYLFEGLGCGQFFERVYRETVKSFLSYSCPIYVVEPDTALLAAVLHLNDWSTILSDPRVIFFVGGDCLEQLRSCWDADFDLSWPMQAFTLRAFPPDHQPGAVAIVREAGLRREQAVRESLADLDRRYAARDAAYWSRRFSEALDGGQPLRILASVSMHTTFLKHSMRDARRALESLGHHVRLLTEDRPYSIIGPLTYHNAIREFDPDLFLNIDHLRPECEVLIPRNLPILTWDQDQLPQVFTRENLQRVARHDFIVGCSKLHSVSLGFNPSQYLNARVPTCPEQFSGPPLTDDETGRYSCDLSFISHASQTPKAFHEQERAAYRDPAVSRLLDAMYEMLPEQLARYTVVDGGVMNVVLAEARRRCGVASMPEDLRHRLCGWYLWRLGDRMFRHEALEWAASWAKRRGRSFRIYGNGWERHPTLSEFASGPAGNGRELLCIYRASRINLQLMPAGFIHQRSLDGLTAGGFFLGRTTPDDFRGHILRRLIGRIDELGVQTVEELLNHRDETLREHLEGYFGDRMGRYDPVRINLLTLLRVNAELLHADEAFSDLPAVLFDSAARFESLADRYISDEGLRRSIAERMQAIVVDQFSYRTAMHQFLCAMRQYLNALPSSQ